MQKRNNRIISPFLKLLLAFVLIYTSVITYTGGGQKREANATTFNIPLFESQNTCSTGDTGDSDSKSGDDSDSDKDDSGSSGSTKSLSKQEKKKIKELYAIMHDEYGFSGAFIAGIIGNWKVETGHTLDPMVTQGSYPPFKKETAESASGTPSIGLGYGQWTNERHTQLVNYAKDKGEDWYTHELQIDFMFNGDSSRTVLYELAKESSDDVMQNTIDFHKRWEISADSDDAVIANRGGSAKAVWEYMKKEGMDGKKDTDKIDKASKGSSDDAPKGKSSADPDSGNTTEESSQCGAPIKDGAGTEELVAGEIGKSVKANGGTGKAIKNWGSYEEIPEKYKKHIELPKLDEKYLQGSPFQANGQDMGQCTEFTWAMMNQLYEGTQKPFEGVTNGYQVYAMYKRNGAKTTHNPTVGYGFSSYNGLAHGMIPGIGHTGMVAGVLEDGKFIIAQYNVPPHPAPSRKVVYSLVDGVPNDAGNNLIFFNGMHGGKVKAKYKKGGGKD